MSFTQAVELLQAHSPALAASQAEVQSQVYQRQAVGGLGQPSFLLGHTRGYYDLYSQVPLDSFHQMGMELVDQLINEKVPGFLRPLFKSNGVVAPKQTELPLHLQGRIRNTSVFMVWPIYTGGLFRSIRHFASAKIQESQAEQYQTYAKVHTTLVERYFGAQLLKQALRLRQDAVRAIQNHDQMAQRALEEGLISKVERLQAKVALEEALRNAKKAQNDSELADLALKKMLGQTEEIRATTPLFVHKKPLAQVDYFTDIALQNHPGLLLVTAKREEARALKSASDSRWLPHLTLLGSHELRQHKANKAVALNLSWTLYSSIDRRKVEQSVQQRIRQANLMEQQAREDISLLIEKNWRNLENTRELFFSLQSGLETAREYVKLRRRGFQEGINTMTELVDAEVNLEKVETERLKAAYDYITALNQLTTSVGRPELFEKFIETSDIRLK
ncbi:MAG: TolC family protein [Neisseriaceae bacterium]